jgi:hypothetical protein
MPKQQTHVPVVRHWCQTLGVLTAISISRDEAEMKLAAYVPMLMREFSDAAFTNDSLNAVARQCVKGFPTYPELAGFLSDWWRGNRPPPPALPPPEPPPQREPPTPEECARVHQAVQEIVRGLRAAEAAKSRSVAEQLDALRVKPRPAAMPLPDALLDRINPLPNGRKRHDPKADPTTPTAAAAAIDPDSTKGVGGSAAADPDDADFGFWEGVADEDRRDDWV